MDTYLLRAGENRKARWDGRTLTTEQVQILDLPACFHLPGPALDQRCFDFLSGHAVCQHPHWMAQVDHLVQADAEIVIGHGEAFENAQKSASIE